MNGNNYLTSLKSKKKTTLKDLLFYENQSLATLNTKKKKSIPVVTGYFPIDFSLNIYKSTDLYKKRYQIEPLRLKNQLKLLKIQKKSLKNEKIIKKIKKGIIENGFSSDLLRLLKSNKIDRFAKRYLEKKNDAKNNINTYSDKKFGSILSSKINSEKEGNKQIDEDKFSNDDIINHKIFLHLKDIKSVDSNNFSEDNLLSQNSESKVKSYMINSSSQTSKINKYEENKIGDEKHKFIKRPQSHTILKNDYIFDFLKSYNNTQKIEKYNQRRLKRRKFTNKFLILDKNKNIKLFSPNKAKSAFNKNIIKKFENNRKLKLPFYDPNDNQLKLFKDLENKLKMTNSKDKNSNFRANSN